MSFGNMVMALVLGTVIGAMSCTVGIGGGILLIPALTFFYGMGQKTAQGTSIATLLLPIGALAFWEYHKAGHVDLRLAMVVAAGFVLGGYFGGHLAQQLSDALLRRVFAVVLIVVAVKLLLVRG